MEHTEAAQAVNGYWSILAALIPGTLAFIAIWFKESRKDARTARDKQNDRVDRLEQQLGESERRYYEQQRIYDSDRRQWDRERIDLHSKVAELTGRLTAYENDKQEWHRTENELRQKISELTGELRAYERFKKAGGQRAMDPPPT